jgi:hypothetical protein
MLRDSMSIISFKKNKQQFNNNSRRNLGKHQLHWMAAVGGADHCQ